MSKGKPISFEKFLMAKHARQYVGTDDDMPEDFERWLICGTPNAESAEEFVFDLPIEAGYDEDETRRARLRDALNFV